MGYSFGQSFTFWFYPLDREGNAVSLSSDMQSQTPAIYVFTDQPSRSGAADGTGALQSITSWAWDAGKAGWSFSVDAIDDPDPNSNVVQRTYWIAINFRLDASEQIQTVLRSLDLERVTGHTRAVEITENDLRDYYPHIDAYSTTTQRLTYIRVGLSQVKSTLKAKGFEWAKLHRPDQLKAVVCYRALAMLFLTQAQAGNDKFAALYQEFKGLFETELSGLTIAYDADDDGDADAEVPAPPGVAWVVR